MDSPPTPQICAVYALIPLQTQPQLPSGCDDALACALLDTVPNSPRVVVVFVSSIIGPRAPLHPCISQQQSLEAVMAS
jgi:hypothetical protein